MHWLRKKTPVKKLGSHIKMYNGENMWYFYVDLEDLVKSAQYKEMLEWGDKNADRILSKKTSQP